jgi:HSP20 family molecular chaperone IbpA
MKPNTMTSLNRWEPFRSAPTLHEQLNRMFDEGFHRQEESNLTTWAPAVDILETAQELVVKADLAGYRSKRTRHWRGKQYFDHSRRAEI